MTNNIINQSLQNTYDEINYISYPFSNTSPYNLMALGKLFGMSVVNLHDSIRVLELGCASGWNIIPHAVNHPNSEFIGVDLSKIQIDNAIEHASTLGLKNMHFKNISIMDIDETYGKFDYIICHGVISWVPEDVRQKIFSICDKNLKDHGIAYISYNTLPGWNMVRTIRDMMLYHSNLFNNTQDKVTQARLLLQFVSDTLKDSKTPYAEVLKNEADLLSKQTDNYLRHDHLEENNKQYYFKDFISEAKKYNLQYLSDTSLSTMYLGNMQKEVAEKLSVINDIVRIEQYMDFINNRRFRTTLLCKNNVQLNRNLNKEDIKKFNLLFNIVPEKHLKDVDLNNNSETLLFFINGNKESSISTSSSCMKAILYTFYENISNPISFDELINISNQKLNTDKYEQIAIEFLNNGMSLVLQGALNLTLQPSRQKPNLDIPHANKLALYLSESDNFNWIIGLNHNAITVNSIEKKITTYMNGNNTKAQILEELKKIIANDKTITIYDNDSNKAIEDQDTINSFIEGYLNNYIQKLNNNAILI